MAKSMIRITCPINRGTASETLSDIFFFFWQPRVCLFLWRNFSIYLTVSDAGIARHIGNTYGHCLLLFRMSERVGERTFVKGECATYHLILQNASFLHMPYITVLCKWRVDSYLKTSRACTCHFYPSAPVNSNTGCPYISEDVMISE